MYKGFKSLRLEFIIIVDGARLQKLNVKAQITVPPTWCVEYHTCVHILYTQYIFLAERIIFYYTDCYVLK